MTLTADPIRPASEAGKLTLLIVDDEEGPRQSLRIVFKKDYAVLVASNGVEAMALARQHTVHIAVLDILMEGMSGVDLLRELKQIDPALEVVMLTAYETLETARQALRHGATDYLNKPFDIPTMRAAVARAAEKVRAAAVLRQTNEQLLELRREIEEQRVNKEVVRAKDEIYEGVLQDLNSPLMVISAFIELINQSMLSTARVEGEQLENIRGDLRNLTGQVERCFQISRRYLSFLKTRETAGQSGSEVRQTLTDLRDLLARHPAGMGHQLVVHDFEPGISVKINGADLLQILLNLTINALQSTSMAHCVEIQAVVLKTPVDCLALDGGASQRFISREDFENVPPLIAIAVSDTGPGIPGPILYRLFEEPFTTKPEETGSGLGLSVVHRLLKAAHSGLHVRTVPGEGAEFTIFLKAV